MIHLMITILHVIIDGAMDTLHYVVNDRPSKSTLKRQLQERLSAQFCFLSDEKRSELIKKLGNKCMLLSPAALHARSSEADARSSLNKEASTTASSDCNPLKLKDARRRSMRMKRSESLLKIVKVKQGKMK